MSWLGDLFRRKVNSDPAPHPSVYALPWQRGRRYAGGRSVHDPAAHYVGWVYAAVRAIATACAGARLQFDVDGMPLPASHPLPQLFRHVNAHHTYRDLMQATLTDLELTGNAYWVKLRGPISGVPRALWAVPSVWIRPVPGSASQFIEAYSVRRGAKETRYAVGDVVHFAYTAPDDPFVGTPPLLAAIESVRADETLAEAQRRTFELGPLPGIILKSATELTREQRLRIRAEFEGAFHGAENAGRLIIAEPGAEVVPFSVKPREMDFLKSGQALRERILACFGVPPSVLGITTGQSESDTSAAFDVFTRMTLGPKLACIAARVTQDVCAEFLPFGVDAAFASPVPADRDADRKDVELALKHDLLTPDEARTRLFG